MVAVTVASGSQVSSPSVAVALAAASCATAPRDKNKRAAKAPVLRNNMMDDVCFVVERSAWDQLSGKEWNLALLVFWKEKEDGELAPVSVFVDVVEEEKNEQPTGHTHATAGGKEGNVNRRQEW